ncbi:M48 family metallopeptidase [Aurantibacillus circumpalustris]|uniref:M48 family metallopeptidase n=1 Tax=Aurantibacillus circumpalustris TaxID=3036359 RepID=UPI00295ACC84|nr:M48 family metallopeptidase [Aurantibacillus circumpalustris]
MDSTGVYNDGFSARQINCTISVTNGHLHIYLQNETRDLLIWDLKNLKSCHLNGSHIIIKYGEYPHHTLECNGEVAKEIYRIWSGNHFIRKAEGLTFSSKRVMVISLIVLFIALGVFTLFYVLPWAGEKAANLIPISTEVQLGESIGEMYAKESDMNDSANYYMHQFVKQLELDDTYKIDVKVVQSEDINAFALPGGKIFVYSGIIEKMENYEELVALLGHEVTHVLNRHSLKNICRSAATSIVVASLFGDVTGIGAGILSQAEQFKQLDYSRDLETEADNNGLQIMVENKVNPQGMLDLLRLLKEEGTEMPKFMKYLSTHPDTDSRISNILNNPELKNEFPENEKLKELFIKVKGCI